MGQWTQIGRFLREDVDARVARVASEHIGERLWRAGRAAAHIGEQLTDGETRVGEKHSWLVLRLLNGGLLVGCLRARVFARDERSN